MIYQAYIAPTEAPPRLLDLKRALITYDKVFVSEPRDRDVIPPQAFMMAIGMPMMGGNMGPVRPIGKIEGYDNQFDRLMDAVNVARHEGLIEVISSYEHNDNFTIGAVQLGNYRLNPGMMLGAYRMLARDNSLLVAALKDDAWLSKGSDFLASVTVPTGGGDGSINDDPAMPLVDGPMANPENRELLTLLARGRIVSALKAIGFCLTNDAIPAFCDPSLHNIIRYITRNAADVIDRTPPEYAQWANRSRALRVAHEEYVDDAALDALSIPEVIRLRTETWREQANAREALMQAIAELARSAASQATFEDDCRARIAGYRAVAARLEQERKTLRLRITCDVMQALAGIGAAVAGGALIQVQTALGLPALLMAGCYYAFQKLNDYTPVVASLAQAEEQHAKAAAYALHSHYERLPANLRR